MSLYEALLILENHNKWRKGADMEPTDPIKLGEAIDIITLTLRFNIFEI
jgi:hypothetical protein